MSAARRRKARDRTRAWREARQDAGTPEAREIDRALAAALMHVVMADRDAGRLPKAFLPAVVHVAAFILEEGHDRQDVRAVVEDRLRKLGHSREVMHARERAGVRRTGE